MKSSRFILPLVASLVATSPLYSQDPAPQGPPPEHKHHDKPGEHHAGPPRKDRERHLGSQHSDRERQERMGKMKQEIEQLRREGKNEEAERRMRDMREQMQREHRQHDGDGRGRRDGAPDGRRAEGPEKIRHLMEASRHLRAAGMAEPAERIERQAKEMQGEFEQQRRQLGEGRDRNRREGSLRQRNERGRGEALGEVRQLREQIERLSREMNQLREEMKRRHPDAPNPQ